MWRLCMHSACTICCSREPGLSPHEKIDRPDQRQSLLSLHQHLLVSATKNWQFRNSSTSYLRAKSSTMLLYGRLSDECFINDSSEVLSMVKFARTGKSSCKERQAPSEKCQPLAGHQMILPLCALQPWIFAPAFFGSSLHQGLKVSSEPFIVYMSYRMQQESRQSQVKKYQVSPMTSNAIQRLSSGCRCMIMSSDALSILQMRAQALHASH